MNRNSKISSVAVTLLLLSVPPPVCAQAQEPQVELAVTYVAQRSLKANTDQNFWLNGGSIELGANIVRGVGIVADVTGSHADSIGSSGVPLSLVTATFGPRYRWRAQRKVSFYGQALVGTANGFGSLFPSTTGAQSSANGLALQVGGGIDYRLKGHMAVRLLDAAWLRTQLPNNINNVQNTLRLGAGLVYRFGQR